MDALLTARDLMKKFSISRSAAYSLAGTAGFPPPIKIGTKMIRWNPDAIEKWLIEASGGKKTEK